MLSDAEYNALVSVLQRAPLLPAEIPTIQAIMAKLQPQKPAEDKAP